MSGFSSTSHFCAAAKSPPTKKKPSATFSIRLSEEERARLERDAGALSLAAHIRLKLFNEGAPDGSKRNKSRKARTPSVELTIISQLLGALGQSRIPQNLNQIAKAANQGKLCISPELATDLTRACADIQAMRRDLIKALGLKPEQ